MTRVFDSFTGSSLDVIGRVEYGLPRFPSESDDSYRGRLKNIYEARKRAYLGRNDIRNSFEVELTSALAPSELDAAIISGTWTPDERACVDCHHFTYFGFDPWCKKHERCTKNGDCCSEWSDGPPKIANSNDVTD